VHLLSPSSPHEHANFESLSRNRISNVSFAVCSAGTLPVLAIMVGIIRGMHAEDSVEKNTKTFNVLIAFTGGIWRTVFHCRPPSSNSAYPVDYPVLCALPWFFLEKRRPGLALPPGQSLLTIGFKQTYVAFRECLRLKQTFLYLVFYFLM